MGTPIVVGHLNGTLLKKRLMNGAILTTNTRPSPSEQTLSLYFPLFLPSSIFSKRLFGVSLISLSLFLFLFSTTRFFEIEEEKWRYFRFFLPEEYYCRTIAISARTNYGFVSLIMSSQTPTPDFDVYDWQAVSVSSLLFLFSSLHFLFSSLHFLFSSLLFCFLHSQFYLFV